MTRLFAFFLVVVFTTIIFPLANAIAAVTTKIAVYTPFSFGRLQSGTIIRRHMTGLCWEPSLAVGRPDAWRCMAGNEIRDPCFSGALNAREVACVADPFAKALDLLTLTKPLPQSFAKSGDVSDGQPWVLRLSNGQECGFVTGATSQIAGMRLNYGCKNGGWLVGDVRRGAGVWTILYAAKADDSLVRQVSIDTAIF